MNYSINMLILTIVYFISLAEMPLKICINALIKIVLE